MLYVCPTPIGNLGDITLRVLETLQRVDLVAAEDTRRTAQLLSHFDISKPLLSFFEHNELRRLPELLDHLRAGRDIALVSDAGMPGISDPGYTLIHSALDEGLAVEVLPGPSSIETALVSSGFPADSFLFRGYLPRKKGELRRALEEIAASGRTCVTFESPRRLRHTLVEAETITGMGHIAVCRELTKRFAEIKRGPASVLLENLPDNIKGEIVLVFAPAEQTDLTTTDRRQLERAVRELQAEGLSTRRVAELVSFFTGAPRRKVYDMALRLKEEH
ncbi:ribosomal RNA small subunit methyltransferase I [bacterium BMS3Abin01]|nr:ribosomal RNA small subunit methyltransferase I [bacterium BMS3Abin01]